MRMIAMLLALFATAEQAAEPNPSRFQRFSDSLIGNWEVTIRETDETGKLLFEERQPHVFSRGIGPQFIEERATDASGHSSMGLVVLSYDPKANLLTQHAFFGFQPGLRFTVEAQLSEDGRSASGTIVTPKEPGFRTHRRMELKWVNVDEFRSQAYATHEGREFLNEEQIYRRLKS